MSSRREFLKQGMATVGGLSMAARMMANGQEKTAIASPFLTIQGDRIVEDGRPIQLRGFNLGNWLLIENFMIGLPWVEYKMRTAFQQILGESAYHSFFDTYVDHFITEADIAFLAEQGFNFVRLPFNYRLLESDLRPGIFLEEGFRTLDRAVSLCRKHGIYMMLDLHAAAGAQARDGNAGSAYGEAFFWTQRQFMDRTCALWRAIAQRYEKESSVFGYNVLNEPVAPNDDIYNEFHLAAIRAIREADRKHVIVIDANRWGRDAASLRNRLFEDPLVMPAIHHYHTEYPPFMRMTEYPAVIDGKRYGKEELAATLEGKYDSKRISRPIIVGEFGVFREIPVQLKMLDDLLEIFEERNWHWTIWSYKDLNAMGTLIPREDTPWKKFMQSSEATTLRNQLFPIQGKFIDEYNKLVSNSGIERDVLEQFPRDVFRGLEPVLLEQMLRQLKRFPNEELAQMARSFAFDNCQIMKDKLAVLKSHIKS